MSSLAKALWISRYDATPYGVRPADVAFGVLWLFITFVSIWDCFLTLLMRHQMQVVELNPVGRWLIDLNGGGVAYLLGAKLVGTLLATSWMVLLYERNPSRGLLVTAPVACFQLWLLLFLTFA